MTSADLLERPPDGEHSLLLYEEHTLGETLAAFAVDGFAAGEPVFLIASADHLGSAARHADLSAAVVFEAEGLLRQLRPAGSIDPDLFAELVADPIRRAAPRTGAVRVYGELVGLLWQEGRPDQAAELERLWNGLADEVDIRLRCGYPWFVFGPETQAFNEVSDLHDCVLTRFATPRTRLRAFPADARSASAARRFVAECLHDHATPSVADVAALLMSEMCANAVLHARSSFLAGVEPLGAGRFKLAVADVDPFLPQPVAPEPLAVGGRGMAMVDMLSSRWGATSWGDGKVVWAEVDSPAPG